MSATPPAPTAGTPVRLGTARGRWLLLATILGSGMAGLDATVVNVALPSIGRDFSSPFSTLQWTVTGYALTLASLILVAGVLGDRYGRRRVFVLGVVWFTAASLLCAVAPTAPLLVLARAVQGVGGALLTPGSLAIIQASVAPEDRGRAVGAWSGIGAVFMAVGPLLGGWLVDLAGWRWVFLVNLPIGIVVTAVALRHVPETRAAGGDRRIDLPGAVAATLALGAVSYALTQAGGHHGADEWLVPGVVGVLLAVAFLAWERRSDHPMLPLGIFRARQFSAANLVTFLVYGGFGAVTLLLVVQLQVAGGYGAIASGLAMAPSTVVMMLLSARSGALAARIGPRLQMCVGPLVMALGLLLMTRVHAHPSYVADVLPAVLVFGLGLVTMVSPLTSTALSSAPDELAGLASGVNNAVARTGSLLAVAAVPPLAGLTGRVYTDPVAYDHGFVLAMRGCAAAVALGGVIAGLTISDEAVRPRRRPVDA